MMPCITRAKWSGSGANDSAREFGVSLELRRVRDGARARGDPGQPSLGARERLRG